MAKLILTLGDGSEATHELDGDVITVGRASDNTIVIDDGSVSTHHAQLNVTGDKFHLKDLNSTNGTRHNGEQVMEADVEVGDELRFGKIHASIQSEKFDDAQPLPEANKAEAVLADESKKPENFSNASPFRSKEKKKNPASTALMALTVVSILAFAFAVFQILGLQPPQ